MPFSTLQPRTFLGRISLERHGLTLIASIHAGRSEKRAFESLPLHHSLIADILVSLIPAGQHPSHRVVERRPCVRSTATWAVSKSVCARHCNLSISTGTRSLFISHPICRLLQLVPCDSPTSLRRASCLPSKPPYSTSAAASINRGACQSSSPISTQPSGRGIVPSPARRMTSRCLYHSAHIAR